MKGEFNEVRIPQYVIVEINGNDIALGFYTQTLELDIGSKRKKDYSMKRFYYDLGFSTTYHRIQGQTVEKLIILLNHHPNMTKGNVTFKSFYVGFTRVKYGNNLRTFKLSEDDKKKLYSLKTDPQYEMWFTNYDDKTNLWKPLGLQKHKEQQDTYNGLKLARIKNLTKLNCSQLKWCCTVFNLYVPHQSPKTIYYHKILPIYHENRHKLDKMTIFEKTTNLNKIICEFKNFDKRRNYLPQIALQNYCNIFDIPLPHKKKDKKQLLKLIRNYLKNKLPYSMEKKEYKETPKKRPLNDNSTVVQKKQKTTPSKKQPSKNRSLDDISPNPSKKQKPNCLPKKKIPPNNNSSTGSTSDNKNSSKIVACINKSAQCYINCIIICFRSIPLIELCLTNKQDPMVKLLLPIITQLKQGIRPNTETITNILDFKINVHEDCFDALERLLLALQFSNLNFNQLTIHKLFNWCCKSEKLDGNFNQLLIAPLTQRFQYICEITKNHKDLQTSIDYEFRLRYTPNENVYWQTKLPGKLPPFCIFYLKFRGQVFNTTPISIPAHVHMPNSQKTIYKLQSIILYKPFTPLSKKGHYATITNINSQWYLIDDCPGQFNNKGHTVTKTSLQKHKRIIEKHSHFFFYTKI